MADYSPLLLTAPIPWRPGVPQPRHSPDYVVLLLCATTRIKHVNVKRTMGKCTFSEVLFGNRSNRRDFGIPHPAGGFEKSKLPLQLGSGGSCIRSTPGSSDNLHHSIVRVVRVNGLVASPNYGPIDGALRTICTAIG